jgi:hypothetical protein
LSFNFDFEVFPAKPPWFSAKIYPFLSFDSPLEFFPEISYLGGNTLCAHNEFTGEYFPGIFSPYSTFKSESLRWGYAVPCISQTLVGFVYPLSVFFFPILQVLFHT